MVTIKDVAKRAGVAISTVSYVLNNSKNVSDDVAERVMAAVRESGYQPNPAARSLRSGKGQIVGLLVPDVVNPHFAAVARIVESACSALGYLSVVFSTGHDKEREAKILDVVSRQRMAGLIMAPTGCDERHGAFLRKTVSVPTVLLDMDVPYVDFSVVRMDHVEIGRLATSHLIGLGHRRIAIVRGIEGLMTSDDRVAGYRQALDEAGIAHDPALELAGDFNLERAQAAIGAALDGGAPPTAAVSLSNMMTVGVFQALEARKLSAPTDLALVGIGELPLAHLFRTPPTVVLGPREQLARDAVAILMRQIEDPERRRVEKLYSPTLIVRESCGGART